MHAYGYIQRVTTEKAVGEILRDATLADLWRAVDVNTPSPCETLAIFPDHEAHAGLVRIVGADALLVRKIQQHARSGGHFDTCPIGG